MDQLDIIETFVRELIAVEGKPVKVRRLEDAVEYILKAVRECNAKLVVRSEFDFAEKMGLDEALNKSGVKVVSVSTLRDPREIIKDADIGVTGADFAVAEIGSIGIVTDREADRLVSALPYIHIALLNSKDILHNLADLKEVLEKYLHNSSRRNNVVSLITGPSRTADIEQQHILGVHGPNQLHVIILEG